MPFNLLYLFISFLGFITIFLIGIQYKTNRNTNAFLTYFILLSSWRFLTYGIPDIFFKDSKYYFETLFTLNAWPTLYLYFSKLISNSNKIKTWELKHYIIPYALFILYCYQGYILSNEILIIITKGSFAIVILINLLYVVVSYKILKKNTKATIVVAPSDHLILKEEQFLENIRIYFPEYILSVSILSFVITEK